MKKRVLSLLLALAMCLSLSVPASAVVPPEDTLSEFAPYEEVNHAIGKTALSIIENAKTRQYYEKHIRDMQLELEEVTTKTVYFEEGYDENGQFNSRVLSKSEVEQLVTSRKAVAETNDSTRASNDSNSRGQLTITFSKSRDARGNYVLNAYAQWDTDPLTNEGSIHPYPGDDYIAIRWGGDGYLKATGYSFAGKYTDNSSMAGYRAISNTYEGYCWSFNERTALFGNVMDHASIVVVLDAYSDLQGRETGATFEYIHTYQSKDASWSVDFTGTDFTAGATLYNCSNQWSIATDVDGLQY